MVRLPRDREPLATKDRGVALARTNRLVLQVHISLGAPCRARARSGRDRLCLRRSRRRKRRRADLLLAGSSDVARAGEAAGSLSAGGSPRFNRKTFRFTGGHPASGGRACQPETDVGVTRNSFPPNSLRIKNLVVVEGADGARRPAQRPGRTTTRFFDRRRGPRIGPSRRSGSTLRAVTRASPRHGRSTVRTSSSSHSASPRLDGDDETKRQAPSRRNGRRVRRCEAAPDGPLHLGPARPLPGARGVGPKGTQHARRLGARDVGTCIRHAREAGARQRHPASDSARPTWTACSGRRGE